MSSTPHADWTFYAARFAWPVLIVGVLAPVARGGILPVDGWMLLSSHEARTLTAAAGIVVCAVWLIAGPQRWPLIRVCAALLAVIMLGRSVRLLTAGEVTWATWGGAATWMALTVATTMIAARLARYVMDRERVARGLDGLA